MKLVGMKAGVNQMQREQSFSQLKKCLRFLVHIFFKTNNNTLRVHVKSMLLCPSTVKA